MADDRFSVELALDRLEGELAAELPLHVRGFAFAFAENHATPAAPAAARRAASLDLALRAFRLSREESRSASRALASRALALLRLLVPIAIESDERVARTRAIEPGWGGWSVLAAARDAAALTRLGVGHVALMRWLHGAVENSESAAWPAPLDGWHDAAPSIAPAFVERAWRDVADRHGARGRCRIVPAPNARPRAFVVEPGGEVIVVVGAIESAAQRFAALHELGHAVAALLVAGTLPRIVDEAAAAYTARLVEHEGALDLPWFTPIAEPARARRRQLAAALAAIERGAPDRPTEKPPWALWHDPGAQAAYVEAEAIADRWWAELGAMPAPGAFAAALVAERTRIESLQTGSALIA